MAFTHVIFDLDGTLLNTLDDLAAAGNHVCAAHGWPTFSTDAYRFKVGNGIPKLIERIIPAEFAGNGRVFEQTFAEFSAYYAAHKQDATRPYPGVIDMLDTLAAAGAVLAVLSNKDHTAVAPLVAHYFGGCFACVQGRIDAFPPKPASPITRYVLDQLDVAPHDVLYVGDSNVDVLTAHNAGLCAAGVSWGFRGRDELTRAGADIIVDTPDELVACILSSYNS